MAVDDLGGLPGWGMEAPPVSSTGFPAGVRFSADARRSRLWAFPLLGGIGKLVVLVPHFIILFFLGIAFSPVLNYSYAGGVAGPFGQAVIAGLAFWILWIPVLFGGRLPTWGYAFVGGFLRWSTRVAAFLFGLSDRYPAFSMHTGLGDVEVSFHIPESNSRWWAVPILGFYVKLLILIPHYVCLAVLGLCAGVLWLVMWIPVLLVGRYPSGPYWFVGGVLRWSLRVSAFVAGLTDRYPPFSLA